MKRIAALWLLILCLCSMAACREEELAEAPNVLVPSIMYNGEVYSSTFRQIPAEVDEAAILGYVTSVVPLSQWPDEEGQANFEIMGAPYAMTSDGLLVLVEHEWTLFEAMEAAEQP